MDDSSYGRGIGFHAVGADLCVQELKNAVSYPDEEDDSDRG